MEKKTSTTYMIELSSIRGIAAVVVLFGHVFHLIGRPLATSPNSFTTILMNQIMLMMNGPGAVEIFFVLSGLVLTLSLEKKVENRAIWAGTFYIKRLFRIYPGMWVSLILAISLLSFARAACVPEICVSKWAKEQFTNDISVHQISLAFLGVYTQLNGPLWSLRIELFYSLVFPILFILLRNSGTRQLTMWIIFILCALPIPRVYPVHYVLAFALGSLATRVPVNERIPYRLIFLIAFAVILFGRQIFAGFAFNERTLEIIEMLAAIGMIYPIYIKKLDFPILRKSLIFYLGEISYSIYVLHFPILFGLLYAIRTTFGNEAIMLNPNCYTLILGTLTFIATIVLSLLVYNLVEMPFQRIGHRIANKLIQLDIRNSSKN